MWRRILGIAFLATVGAVLSLGASPDDVAAECFGFDRWPSFRAAARSADTIIIGHVVDGYDEDSTSRFYTFALEVDEVLRGRAGSRMEFRDVVRSGLPETVCPGESILRVRIGERIAMAFGARYVGVPKPVTAVAFVNWPPDPYILPGVERLTARDVRFAASLPQTDTDPVLPTSPSGPPLLPILLGLLAGFVTVRHLRSRGALP